jgi:restriction endonuclease Mrr
VSIFDIQVSLQRKTEEDRGQTTRKSEKTLARALAPSLRVIDPAVLEEITGLPIAAHGYGSKIDLIVNSLRSVISIVYQC